MAIATLATAKAEPKRELDETCRMPQSLATQTGNATDLGAYKGQLTGVSRSHATFLAHKQGYFGGHLPAFEHMPGA